MNDSKEVKAAENDAKSLIVRVEDEAKVVAEKIEAFFENLIKRAPGDKHADLLALHIKVHEAAGTADVNGTPGAAITTAAAPGAQESAGTTGSD